jgi:molybdate transport system substrate-binding protein
MMMFISLLLIVQALGIVGCGKDSDKVEKTEPQEKVLMVGAGAGLKPALDPIAAMFTQKTGIEVVYSYLCSAMVLSSMRLTQSRDVMIPGSEHFMDIAIEKGIIEPGSVGEAGYMIPVIVVQKENPKNITRLEDLARPGLRVGIGEPEALAVGRLTVKMLKKHGLYEKIMENVVMTGGSAPKLILALAMGNLDAQINWMAVSNLFKTKVDTILIKPEKLMYTTAPIGMTKYSKKKNMAQQYIDFVSSKQGRAIFADHGFALYFDPKEIEKFR